MLRMIPLAAASGIGFLCLPSFFFGKHGELHEKKTAGKQQGDNKIKDKITLAGFLALYVAIVLAMAFAIPVLGTMAAH